MNITPIVYETTLTAKTGGALVNAINNVLISTLGSHHWEVVSYTAGSSIQIRCLAETNRIVNFVGTTNDLVATLSFDGGTTFSPGSAMSPSNYNLNDTSYGISTSSFFVVEIEDAIVLLSGKGTNGGSSLSTGGFGMGLAAGSIFMPIDRNLSQGFNGEGMLGGLSGVRGAADSTLSVGWISINNAAGVERSQMWADGWHKVSIPSITYSRSSSSPAPASLNAVGDGQANDRFVPYFLSGSNSGATAGLIGYTKYIRAHKNRVGGETTQNTIIDSNFDANVKWRHNRGSGLMTANSLYVWCPSGAEITV
jgi:hypothetical protein